MNLDKAFPNKLILTLPEYHERRIKLAGRLIRAGIKRFDVHDGFTAQDLPRSVTNYESGPKLAHSIATRQMIERARRNNWLSVLILEDDVVFHPEFQERLEGIELPEDWGMFYLGGIHCSMPETVSPGLVKAWRIYDTHAYAIHARYYGLISEILRDKSSRERCTDLRISSLHTIIPTYACFPNLAWQDDVFSIIAGRKYTNYLPDGRQAIHPECVLPIFEELEDFRK
jgi:hypothetical protein